MERQMRGSPSRSALVITRSIVGAVTPGRRQALRRISRRAKSLKRRLPQRNLFRLCRLPTEPDKVETQAEIHASRIRLV